MKHKTEFENMNATQRSLHNLCCILDGDDLLSYERSISAAIDEITDLKQQRDELLKIVDAVAHIGCDFGFGIFELQDADILKARELRDAIAKTQGDL
jgi:hypothetical protein